MSVDDMLGKWTNETHTLVVSTAGAGVHWPLSRWKVQKPFSPRAASSNQISHGLLGSRVDNRSARLGGMLAIGNTQKREKIRECGR